MPCTCGTTVPSDFVRPVCIAHTEQLYLFPQVNFNFTFPHLKCEYASVDATNFMGTHDAGLSARVSPLYQFNDHHHP